MSGTMKNLIMLPLIYTSANCETRPSRPVTVISFSAMFKESSAASYVRNCRRQVANSGHTFSEFSSVQLAILELDGDYVAKRFVQKLDGYTETAGHRCLE